MTTSTENGGDDLMGVIACSECGYTGTTRKPSTLIVGKRCPFMDCNGFIVEYVPSAATTGAVSALREIARMEPDPNEGVRPLDDLIDRMKGEAENALDRLGGR